MKYQFKFPFLDNKMYMISHRIFLSSEQRKQLQSSEIEVTGICVPVIVIGTKTDEPANEVFCRYKIVPSNETKVEQSNEWTIFLTAENVKSLDDIRDFRKDPGSEFVAICRYETLKVGGLLYPVIHQIVMSDINELEESLHFVHLPHISSK